VCPLIKAHWKGEEKITIKWTWVTAVVNTCFPLPPKPKNPPVNFYGTPFDTIIFLPPVIFQALYLFPWLVQIKADGLCALGTAEAGVSGLIKGSWPLCAFGPDLRVLSGVLGFPHHIHIRPRKVPSRAQVARGPAGLEVWQSPAHPQASECLDWLEDAQVFSKRKMEYVSLCGWERGSYSALTSFTVHYHHYKDPPFIKRQDCGTWLSKGTILRQNPKK